MKSIKLRLPKLQYIFLGITIIAVNYFVLNRFNADSSQAIDIVLGHAKPSSPIGQAEYSTNIPRRMASVEIHRRPDASAFVSGPGSGWQRTYYLANHSMCEDDQMYQAMPMFDNGFAAGPLLYHSDGTNTNVKAHEAEHFYQNLDVIRALNEGTAFRIPLPYQAPDEKNNQLHDRVRMTAATGVVFIDDHLLAAASYGRKMVYLYYYDSDAQTYKLLDSAINQPPDDPDREAMHVDLIDYDGKDLILTANFHDGTQTIFRLDRKQNKLVWVQEINPWWRKINWCHGARFYPYTDSNESNIIMVTSNNHHFPMSIRVRLYDWINNNALGDFMFYGNRYEEYVPKDVVFMDKYNFLVSLTRNILGIWEEHCSDTEDIEHYSTLLVHFRMHFDPNDVANGKRKAGMQREFEEINRIEIKYGNPDGIDYKDGVAVFIDQFWDRITFVRVDPTGKEPMSIIVNETGYVMPHDVAFSKTDPKVMAVSCNGDNSIIVQNISDIVLEELGMYNATKVHKAQRDHSASIDNVSVMEIWQQSELSHREVVMIVVAVPVICCLVMVLVCMWKDRQRMQSQLLRQQLNKAAALNK